MVKSGKKYLQEIKKLRDALYPSLMCAAAKAGDNQALETLRNLVSRKTF